MRNIHIARPVFSLGRFPCLLVTLRFTKIEARNLSIQRSEVLQKRIRGSSVSRRHNVHNSTPQHTIATGESCLQLVEVPAMETVTWRYGVTLGSILTVDGCARHTRPAQIISRPRSNIKLQLRSQS